MTVRERSSRDPQNRNEGHPIEIGSTGSLGVDHQGADGVVAAQVAPFLLQYKGWGFRA